MANLPLRIGPTSLEQLVINGIVYIDRLAFRGSTKVASACHGTCGDWVNPFGIVSICVALYKGGAANGIASMASCSLGLQKAIIHPVQQSPTVRAYRINEPLS